MNKYGTNKNTAIGLASGGQTLASSETYDAATDSTDFVRVIVCTTSGTVTGTLSEDTDTIALDMTAGQTITWGVWKKLVADASFEGIIAG